jgi:hypothetical protein
MVPDENAPSVPIKMLCLRVISLILAIIALILMRVNSNLKKMSDDHEGIHRPEPVPFFHSAVYIAMVAILFS